MLLCSDPDKPILRLAAGDYTLLLNQIVGFQHHLLAEKLNMVFGPEPVFDLQVDALQGIDEESAAKLTPVAGAVLSSADPVKSPADLPPGHLTAGRLLKKSEPIYPEGAKSSRIQGIVVLSCRIGLDGKTTPTDVLQSPSQLLSHAAEEMIKKWVYEPYLLDGKPTEVVIPVHINFTLSH